jgi:putative ABC transport system substrate-binding protein
VVGFINSGSAQSFSHLAEAFARGLAEERFLESRNLTIEYRWAEGRYELLPAIAHDLVRQNVAVIAATGGAGSALAAKSATQSIPVIFVLGGDPVALGVVPSLNRPGGLITGITQRTAELSTKRLGLLHELLPQMRTVGVLVNPDFPDGGSQEREIESAARNLRVEPFFVRARNEGEFASAFRIITDRGVDALIVGADPLFNARRDQLVPYATRSKIPTIYEFREFARAGGLMSYGTDLGDAYRLGGIYVGRVLRGTKPEDLPIVQASRFELVLNLTAANLLGVTFPPTLLARADEVIE